MRGTRHEQFLSHPVEDQDNNKMPATGPGDIAAGDIVERDSAHRGKVTPCQVRARHGAALGLKAHLKAPFT
jgi:hypothetical protein